MKTLCQGCFASNVECNLIQGIPLCVEKCAKPKPEPCKSCNNNPMADTTCNTCGMSG